MSSLVVLEVAELERLLETTVTKAIARLAPAEPKEVFTLEEAAEFIRRSPKGMTKLVLEHGLPAHYQGREPRFKRSELLAWLDTLPNRPPVEKP